MLVQQNLADTSVFESLMTSIDKDGANAIQQENLTVKAVESKGLRVDIAAPTKDMPSMSMALQKYIQKMNKK